MDDKSIISTKRTQIGVGGFNVSDRAKALVMEVLDSNRITAGPKMAEFERAIAAIHGCKYGLMCNSGTSALQIALAALKEKYSWRDGDEVIVPAVTFVATSNVVMYNNLKPVFVDVEPQYYCLDPWKIEQKITSRTRAIMPVHLAGQPCDMEPILEIAKQHDLRIVEDSAEAMFANDKGFPVGSFGDVGCFSTYAAHMISTGVGGLCTTNDPELIVMLKSIMNHGRDSIYITIDDDKAAKGEALFQIANSRFSFVRLGHSFRCTEMEAALGIAQFEEHEQSGTRRREIVRQLNEGLADLQDFLRLPYPRKGSTHSYMFYALTILDERIRRDDLIRFLEDNSIETRYLLPLINQPIYREIFGNLDRQFPVAAGLNENSFYIGCSPDISDEEVGYVVEKFHQFFGAVSE